MSNSALWLPKNILPKTNLPYPALTVVAEDLRNTADCRCASDTLEPSLCPSGQTQLKFCNLNCIVQKKINNMEQFGTV